MKSILNRLIRHETITKQEAKAALMQISNHEVNEAQIAAFLTVFMMRNITIDELDGFREALIELCIPVNLKAYNPIDLCGTGGDGKNTFNISTSASFLTATCGVNVAKHGNYGVSSVSGSSNVLEAVGIKFTNNAEHLERQINETGICILHAPLFHPAMKAVAPIRKSLAVKTFFNMLGPMVNPVQPQHQLVGVFNLELMRLYAYLYQKTDKKYSILHDSNGYDEVSLTGKTRHISRNEDQNLTPEDFNCSSIKADEIYGGKSISESAEIFTSILKGKGTKEQHQVVAANAALAISLVKNISRKQAFEIAYENLLQGKAYEVLQQLKTLSN